jgi:hypothetical protein
MKTVSLTPEEIAIRVELINVDLGINLQRITRIERDYAYCDAYGSEAEIEFTDCEGEIIITGVFDLSMM